MRQEQAERERIEKEEAEKRRLAEEKARAEAARKAAEEKRIAEEKARVEAEAKAKQAEERKRIIAATKLQALVRGKAARAEAENLKKLLNKEEMSTDDAMNYFDNAVTQENIADDFISIEVKQAGEVEGGKKPAKKPKRKANKTKRAKKSNKKKRKPKRKTLRKIKKIIFR